MSRVLAAVVTLSLVALGCGDDTGSAGCREVREAEDPASARHVLSPDGYRYLTDPPTSGPHIAGPVPAGVLDEPVPPPVQVRILETGGAMVQYDSAEIGTDDLEVLATLERVVVAPGEELPAPVVATAWVWKLTCDEVDVERIERFVADRPAGAPGAD